MASDLVGLEKVGYDGTIVWSRYSEPLSERRILDRIRELAREMKSKYYLSFDDDSLPVGGSLKAAI